MVPAEAIEMINATYKPESPTLHKRGTHNSQGDVEKGDFKIMACYLVPQCRFCGDLFWTQYLVGPLGPSSKLSIPLIG